MGYKPVIVEDLGYMTESVRQMVKETGFPNMKVLQFGFDPDDIGSSNDYLVHNIPEHCVVYHGTHDNDPINGWFAGLSAEEQQMIREYFGCEKTAKGKMNEVFVRAGMMCRAETCVILIQDHLGMGHEARMNDPSHQEDNWYWRIRPGALNEETEKQIFEITRRYGRLNWDADSVQQRQWVK